MTDPDDFQREVVRHVETSLARSMFNCDENAAYSATSLAFRDQLILDWNRTQQRQTFRDSKRVYYLSLEFLMGRALDNAMLNVGLKDTAKSESITGRHDLSPLDYSADAIFQPGCLSWAFVSKTSSARNMTLLWEMAVLGASLLASWTVLHRSTTLPGDTVFDTATGFSNRRSSTATKWRCLIIG